MAAVESEGQGRSGRAGRIGRELLSRVDVVPFAPSHRAAAAALLAERHRRERAREPLLPAVDVTAVLDATLALPDAVGRIATDGTVRAFLVGAPFRSAMPAAIVPASGHAGDAGVLPALYDGLLPAGDHHVQLGEHDPATRDAFAALGFRDFLVVMLAALPLAGIDGPRPVIRQATTDDLDAIVALDRMQQEHHTAPPMSLPPSADVEARWRCVLDDPRAGVWLAFDRRRAVGMLVLQPPGTTFSLLHLPAAAIHLPDAIVAPDARGRGVGAALLAESLGWVHAIGYRHVALHVHAANAPARRFWTAHGFRTVAHQMVRPAATP